MKILNITLFGSVPSKKNSRNIFVRGGRPVNIPSKDYELWHKDAAVQLIGVKSAANIVSVHLEFFFKANHRKDLTNTAESILDLLVDCKIIEDDSWQVVPQVILKSAGIDKMNPRVKITITSQ